MWLLYRRTWRGSIFGSFAQPVLFLIAMGIGLGSYVNKANPASLQGVPYLQFLAPALLVSTVMQGSVFEATFPVLGGFRWIRRYHAMYATPLGPYAIAFGQIAWIATRATLVASIFCLVILLFNAAPTLGIVLAIPVGTLTALAFASWIAAFMSTQYDTTAFNAIWRFGITPLFLFSGTFFPIDQLPAQIQWIAWLLPLWHGVALARALSLGIVMDDPLINLAHLLILAAMAIGRARRDVRVVPPAAAAMSAFVAAARVLPIGLGSRRATLLIERNIYVYRRGWMVIFSGFFEPLFYLVAIGVGIGGMIGEVPGPNGTPIPYALFVAPALLATASMNGAIAESTFNVFFKLNYAKTYDAILSTPLGPGDVALGEIGWSVIRATLYALGFMVVILVLGLVASPWAIFAVPAATLLAFAFAAVGMAATTFMRSWQDFDLIQLFVLPLFLFSGTFYPITSYPPLLQLFVRVTPLYQGVDLIRSLVIGDIGPTILVHVVYLSVMGFAGLWVVSKRLDKLLLK